MKKNNLFLGALLPAFFLYSQDYVPLTQQQLESNFHSYKNNVFLLEQSTLSELYLSSNQKERDGYHLISDEKILDILKSNIKRTDTDLYLFKSFHSSQYEKEKPVLYYMGNSNEAFTLEDLCKFIFVCKPIPKDK